MDARKTYELEITRVREGTRSQARDVVAREVFLHIYVNGEPEVSLAMLPGNERELALGYCLSSGIIKRADQVKSLDVEIGAGSDFYSEVRVWTETENGAANFKGGWDVPVPGCSRLKVESGATFSKATVIKSPLILEEAQDLFKRTGGTHGAGAFDSEGTLLAVMEDVGRHNALDKIIGALLLRSISFEEVGVVLSGRLALDMILKAGKAGIPLLCSISAPTDLAILTANEIGMTLAGFVRGENFNIYSHPSRIVG